MHKNSAMFRARSKRHGWPRPGVKCNPVQGGKGMGISLMEEFSYMKPKKMSILKILNIRIVLRSN
jgi:hypothetical protein